MGWGSVGKRLQQTQFAGAGDGFGAPLHLQFVEDPAVIPFDRVQGQEKPLADLTIRETYGQELKYFYLAWLSGRSMATARCAIRGWAGTDQVCLHFLLSSCKESQQFTDIVRHTPVRGCCGQKLLFAIAKLEVCLQRDGAGKQRRPQCLQRKYASPEFVL